MLLAAGGPIQAGMLQTMHSTLSDHQASLLEQTCHPAEAGATRVAMPFLGYNAEQNTMHEGTAHVANQNHSVLYGDFRRAQAYGPQVDASAASTNRLQCQLQAQQQLKDMQQARSQQTVYRGKRPAADVLGPLQSSIDMAAVMHRAAAAKVATGYGPHVAEPPVQPTTGTNRALYGHYQATVGAQLRAAERQQLPQAATTAAVYPLVSAGPSNQPRIGSLAQKLHSLRSSKIAGHAVLQPQPVLHPQLASGGIPVAPTNASQPVMLQWQPQRNVGMAPADKPILYGCVRTQYMNVAANEQQRTQMTAQAQVPWCARQQPTHMETSTGITPYHQKQGPMTAAVPTHGSFTNQTDGLSLECDEALTTEDNCQTRTPCIGADDDNDDTDDQEMSDHVGLMSGCQGSASSNDSATSCIGSAHSRLLCAQVSVYTDATSAKALQQANDLMSMLKLPGEVCYNQATGFTWFMMVDTRCKEDICPMLSEIMHHRSCNTSKTYSIASGLLVGLYSMVAAVVKYGVHCQAISHALCVICR